MKFSVLNRVVLLGLLPDTGGITTMRQVRELREALAFADKETKELGIKQGDDGSISWNPKHKVKDKEIEIGEIMHGVIQGLLEDKNEAEELRENHIDLWDLFECSEPKKKPSK